MCHSSRVLISPVTFSASRHFSVLSRPPVAPSRSLPVGRYVSVVVGRQWQRQDLFGRRHWPICSDTLADNRLFKVESPARRLMQNLLSRFICYGKTVPGALLDRVVSMGESPTKRAFNSQHVPKTSVTYNDGLVDSIRHLLFTDNFTKLYSHEHILVHLLTTAL